MHHVPDSFREALRIEFDGRLSIRWSQAENAWLIEQKIGRGAAVTARRLRRKSWMSPQEWEREQLKAADVRFRAEHGLNRVCAIAPGDRARCIKHPSCAGVVRLSLGKWKQTKCETCGTPQPPIAFFPLNDWLITELRRTDPYRGGLERVFAELEEGEEERERAVLRRLRFGTEALWKDSFTQVFGIQSVGWTPLTGAAAPFLPASRPFIRKP